MVSSPDLVAAFEESSIRRSRHETIRVGSLLVVLVLAAVGLRARQQGSGVSDVVILLSVLLAVTGAVARRALPWLSLGGIAGGVIATSLVVDNRWRADASTAVFVLAYFGVVLLPRRRALVWIAVPVGLWVIVAPPAAITVPLFGSSVNLRWLGLLQLVVSSLLLWFIWERELEAAGERDRVTLERERDRLDALQMQERLRAWRRMLVQTHETVLNDIRYVLASDVPDAQRLSEQLRSRERELVPAVPRETVGSIAGKVAASEGLAKVQLVDTEVRLTRRQAEAFTAALREVVRNAQRHASVSSMHLRCIASPSGKPGGLTVQVRYEQGALLSLESPGIGRAMVIDGSLESIGGSSRVVSGGIDILLPTNVSERDDEAVATSDVGRVVLSAVTVGNTIGGSFYSVALLIGKPGLLSFGALLASVVATLGGAVAMRFRSLSGEGMLAVVLGASAAAVLASRASAGCGWSEVAVIVATLSGFSLCAALVWAPSARWWLLGLLWVAAMMEVSRSLPESCGGTTSASFRAAVLPGAFFVVITLSLRSASRSTRRRMELQRVQISELAEADAAEAASQVLHDAVREATTIMGRVADGVGLDPSGRERLRCLDATIRAAVQVDPGQAGGISMAAKELVDVATERGVPVRVLTIRDSGDRTPVAPELIDFLKRVLPERGAEPAVIQVLVGPADDTLVVTTSRTAAHRGGVTASITRTDGPDELSFDADDADDSDIAVMFLRRERRGEMRR